MADQVWTRAVDRLLDFLLIALVAILTGVVFLQVLARFALKVPIPWTEEVSRLSFVYSIFIGACIGVRRRAHLSVDFVLVYLPPRVRAAVQFAAQVAVAIVLVAIVWLGVRFVAASGVQTTPVLSIPFRYIYVIIPAGGLIMLAYHLANMLDDARGKGANG